MSEFTFRLKDGTTATVTVGVTLPAEARDAQQRSSEIENYLGGFLAGASPMLIAGELVSARPSDIRLPLGGHAS